MNNNKLVEKFKNILIKEDLKLTPQRIIIFEEMMKTNAHRECEEIFLKLKKNKMNVSRATLYRTLDILVKNNFIRKMDIGDGRVRYEKKIGTLHHDHMICIETGDIIEFHNQDIENIQDTIAKKHGYKIIRHVHQLFVKPIK